jgi:hypothetical protein
VNTYYNPAEQRTRNDIAIHLLEMARNEIFSGPKDVIIEVAIDVLRTVKSPEAWRSKHRT